MNRIFHAIIIGAGNIGAFYDSPGSDLCLTHAHAFSMHPGFKLHGFIDVDIQQAERAAHVWGCRAYENIAQAFNDQKIDIVCIASPDETHYHLLKEISGHSLKAVFTEKPLTQTLRQAEEVVDIYGAKHIPVCVNYRRCFVPEYRMLREEIKVGKLGAYMTGSGYYGKGLLHNGSHLIQLLGFLIGDIRECRFRSGEKDFYQNDPSVSAVLFFDEHKAFYMHHIDCRLFTVFEVDLFFEKGRVRIYETGLKIEYSAPGKDSVYPAYDFLMKTRDIDTQLGKSLFFAVDNIYEHLTREASLQCTMDDAFKTMRVCDMIQSSERRKPDPCQD